MSAPDPYREPTDYGSIPLGEAPVDKEALDAVGSLVTAIGLCLGIGITAAGGLFFVAGASAAALPTLSGGGLVLGFSVLLGISQQGFSAGDAERLNVEQHHYVVTRGGTEELRVPIADLTQVTLDTDGLAFHHLDGQCQVLVGATVADEHLAWLNEDLRRYQARHGRLSDVPQQIRKLAERP